MTKTCFNVNIPTVDNSTDSCTECGYTDWSCISIDEAISYLAVVEDESLKSAFNKLVTILIAKAAAISAIQAREATYVTLTGTQTLTNKTLTAPKFADLGYIADANGNELVILDTVTTAVNEITIANAATATNPTITATGGDTNISLRLLGKGTGAPYGNLETIILNIIDDTSVITAGAAKYTFRMPYAFKLLKTKASLKTASSVGIPSIDINLGGVSIFSTTLTIDATELTSATATTPAVISTSTLTDDGEITVDIDVAGTGAIGLKVYLIGYATALQA